MGRWVKKYAIDADGNVTLEQTISLGATSRAQALRIDGNYAFVDSYTDNEVKIVDISNIANIRYIGSVSDFPAGQDVSAGMVRVGDWLYITTSSGIVRKADISQPHSPVRVARVGATSALQGGDTNGSHLFMADTYAGLLVFDIQDPLNPQHISTQSGTSDDKGDEGLGIG